MYADEFGSCRYLFSQLVALLQMAYQYISHFGNYKLIQLMRDQSLIWMFVQSVSSPAATVLDMLTDWPTFRLHFKLNDEFSKWDIWFHTWTMCSKFVKKMIQIECEIRIGFVCPLTQPILRPKQQSWNQEQMFRFHYLNEYCLTSKRSSPNYKASAPRKSLVEK